MWGLTLWLMVGWAAARNPTPVLDIVDVGGDNPPYVPMTIGYPPQGPFRMSLELGKPYSWINSMGPPSQPAKPATVSAPGTGMEKPRRGPVQQCFSEANSTTYRRKDGRPGSFRTPAQATELLQIDEDEYPMQLRMTETRCQDPEQSPIYAGGLGLSFVNTGEVNLLINSVQLPTASFFIPSRSSPQQSAALVFGELSHPACGANERRTSRITSPERWQFGLHCCKTTRYLKNTNQSNFTPDRIQNATLNAAVDDIYAPVDYAFGIYRMLGARRWPQRRGVYYIPCSRQLNATIAFDVSTAKEVNMFPMSFSAMDLVEPDPDYPSRCVVKVRVGGFAANHWVLGKTFMRRFCTTLHFRDRTVSIAPVFRGETEGPEEWDDWDKSDEGKGRKKGNGKTRPGTQQPEDDWRVKKKRGMGGMSRKGDREQRKTGGWGSEPENPKPWEPKTEDWGMKKENQQKPNPWEQKKAEWETEKQTNGQKPGDSKKKRKYGWEMGDIESEYEDPQPWEPKDDRKPGDQSTPNPWEQKKGDRGDDWGTKKKTNPNPNPWEQKKGNEDQKHPKKPNPWTRPAIEKTPDGGMKEETEEEQSAGQWNPKKKLPNDDWRVQYLRKDKRKRQRRTKAPNSRFEQKPGADAAKSESKRPSGRRSRDSNRKPEFKKPGGEFGIPKPEFKKPEAKQPGNSDTPTPKGESKRPEASTGGVEKRPGAGDFGFPKGGSDKPDFKRPGGQPAIDDQKNPEYKRPGEGEADKQKTEMKEPNFKRPGGGNTDSPKEGGGDKEKIDFETSKFDHMYQ